MRSLQELAAAAQALVAAKAVKKKTPKKEARRPDPLALPQTRIPEHEWTETALVLVLDRTTCACGAVWQSPLGLFICSEHVRLANTLRLRKVEATIPALPPRRSYQDRAVQICTNCSDAFGLVYQITPAPQQPPSSPDSLHFGDEWKSLTAPIEETEDE